MQQSIKMDVCTIGILVFLCLLSTLKTVNGSVNICRYPTAKNTTQSLDFSEKYPSSKAVDGCTKQVFTKPYCCSQTHPWEKEAWWQVDLGERIVMEYVKIYYRDEGFQQRKTFGGYQIYQSNNPDWRSGYLCYRDETPRADNLSLTPRIPCTGTTRYLTIYSDRRSGGLSWYSDNAYLELCEVEVYGCPLGRFGNSSCDSYCSAECVDNLCDPVTGKCVACTPGNYGSHCNQTCSLNCKDNRCMQNSGQCKECNPGYYGSKCNKTCSSNCKHIQCMKNNGQCEACTPGNYGSHCNQTCSLNCKDNRCMQNRGQCEECNPGYYGSKCNKTCSSNCKHIRCMKNNGQCEECNPGYYGSKCNQTCPSNCKHIRCMKNNGQCEACESGYFGLNCEEKCGQCITASCNISNGICLCSETAHGICGCNKGWEGKQCTTEVMSDPDDQTVTWVSVGVAVGIGILLLVAIAVVVIRKRKLSPTHEDNHRDGSSETTRSPDKQANSAETSGEDRQAYVCVSGIPIHELCSIIDSKMENDAAAFAEEFETFPWGAVHPHEAGKKSLNKKKNRFVDIFPYDHSRILLHPTRKNINAGYINANYIDGIENEKVYIASQGPKPNTVDEFWRMVWQLNSGKIVMLTNLREGRNIKCHKYWPDEGESLVTKTFELTIDRERTYAFYIIRDISIIHKKTNEERQVHQFHFTSWPDHGTPDTVELVLFNRHVTSYKTQLTGQMIVHCSAGIGRTGTFIGLDALLAHGEKTGKVDIPRYVGIMRSGRMNMIQTCKQYIALHEALAEGFNSQRTLVSRVNYPAVLEAMCPMDTQVNETTIHQEFKVLQSKSPDYSSDCFEAALLTENIEKNRHKEILAADMFRPPLQSHSPNMTDYINAVIIQSHTSKSGYLMTQFPLVNTINDFWTMVFDYGCENIVVLGKPTEEEDWLREEVGVVAAGNTISVKRLQDRSLHTELDIVDYQVVSERSGNETIRIFSMSQWSSNSLLPPSDSSLLQLLEQLDSRRRSDNTRPVVVMCRDGCTQSGLFCCISNLRDQMKMDEEVDIFQTARQLKKRRPEALVHVKQYQYCYNILGLYMDSTDVSIN